MHNRLKYLFKYNLSLNHYIKRKLNVKKYNLPNFQTVSRKFNAYSSIFQQLILYHKTNIITKNNDKQYDEALTSFIQSPHSILVIMTRSRRLVKPKKKKILV